MAPASHRRAARLTASAAVLMLALTACGADTEPIGDVEDPAGAAIQQGGTAVGGGHAVGGAFVGPPSPSPETLVGPPLPETVDVRYPDLLVRTPADATREDVIEVTALDAVDHLAGVSQLDSAIVQGETSHPVTLLATDPATFRPLTPEVTANVRAVWERMQEGDVLVRHDIAHALGLELGGTVILAGRDGPVQVRVGAFASNGAPPLADLIVPWHLRDRFGGDGVNLLLVSLAEDASADQARTTILDLVEGADVTVRQRPAERQAALAGGPGIRRFESFSYVDLGDGLIVIDAAWVHKWIVTVDLPFLGRTRCHRLMVPQLIRALEQIGNEGLHGHFDRSQFAGCWVPRHIDWDPSKPLSMHAWGLAVDINSRDNALGARPTMHPRIVEIFQSWGFEWGGHWTRPDGMHFELERLIDA
ncbi:MAG TPA: M15 family metallopeptidase [Nitriliruptorales bacterium]